MIKNKRLILFLTLSCILVFLSCALISGNSKKNIEKNNRSWMKDISDEKKLSEIMIPGVHNAAASYLPFSLFSKCQKSSISDLLNEGYRYLDVRIGVDEVAGEKELVLYHNFLPCYRKDGIIPRRLTFDDVSRYCCDFLEENPSETIIFMVKYEHGGVSVSEFEKLVEKAIEKNSDKWLLTDKTPILKDSRGKIVLFRRYEDTALLGSKAGIECLWDEQRDTKNSDLNSIISTGNEDGIIVQDMYKLSANEKWSVFSYVCDNASKSDYPIINFLSTTGKGSIGVPIYFSANLNKRFMNYSIEDIMCPQWIIVDFGDEKIAEKIIKANF